jgi:large-conductance mechanosensitive channel
VELALLVDCWRSPSLFVWNAYGFFENDRHSSEMFSGLKKESSVFDKQMDSRRLLLTIAIAIVIGGALKDFFSSITHGLVAPLIAAAFPSVQSTVTGLVIQVGPVKLQVGEVIGATATLLIALLVVSLALPYIKAYAPIKGAARPSM